MTTAALPDQIKPASAKPTVWPWFVLALSYYLVCCLMHLRFSLWLVRHRETLFGGQSYAELVPAVVVASMVGLVFWLARSLRISPQPWRTGAFWLLWLAVATLVHLRLIFSMNEYAHYPQYAMLAFLLARAMDPRRQRWYLGRVLFWTTLMGMGDELLQYLWITASYCDYLDFNDFYINLVAAAGGLLLYYGPATRPASSLACPKPVLEWLVTAAIAVSVLAGLQSGYVLASTVDKIPPGGIVQLADGSRRLYLQRGPDFYGSWQDRQRQGRYFVMPPLTALFLMALTGLAFASYRNLCSSARPRNAQPGRKAASNSSTGSGRPNK
jgi:hypothetical protein